MTLQIFINDLSLTTEDLSHAEAVSLLKHLVAVVRSARNIESSIILNCEHSINELPLGGHFNVAAVRNSGVCVTETQFLKNLQSRAPLSQALCDPKSPDSSSVEYRMPQDSPILAGEVAKALGLSHLMDGLAVSMPTHSHWLNSKLILDKLELKPDGELQTTAVFSRNACCENDVHTHSDALRSLNLPRFSNGVELWENRTLLLPNLDFIPRTQNQIENVLEGDPTLASIWGKLLGIDRAIEQWRRTGIAWPVFPFNVRPESRRRMALVRFIDSEGVERSFSDHTDFAPSEGRIHFIIDTKPHRHAIIGHVGRKLGIG